jgi:hypothetical protein
MLVTFKVWNDEDRTQLIFSCRCSEDVARKLLETYQKTYGYKHFSIN